VNGWGWSAGVSYSLFVAVPLFFLALGVLIGTAKMRSERRQPPVLSGIDPHGDLGR
jgi:surface polysaccharide O-acyltransferase-like enzyme